VIVWIHQRGLDVVPERGRHVGDGAGDPAEPEQGLVLNEAFVDDRQPAQGSPGI
jgi:hypothetical protein